MRIPASASRLAFTSLCYIFLFFILVTGAQAADFNISSEVQIIQSRLMFDRSTNTSYLDISLKNISQRTLQVPIKIVIQNISDSRVTVSNADGTTSDSKPYYDYSTAISGGNLSPGATSSTRRVTFKNPNRVTFSFQTIIIQQVVAEAAAIIGSQGGTVEITNQTSSIYGTKVEIPEGAIPLGVSSALITIQPSDDSTAVKLPLENYESITPMIRINSSTPLTCYVKVTLPLKAQVTSSDMIVISHYDDTLGVWNPLPLSLIDDEKNTLTFFTPGFSIYEGIKYRGLPASDQLNMDLFMRYEYPIQLEKINNAKFMMDATSDFEKEHTTFISNKIDTASALMIGLNGSQLGGLTPAEYSNQIIDILSLSFGLAYSKIGDDDSKDWIDPMVDMAKCVLEGTIKSMINHTSPEVEVGKSCAIDAMKNTYFAALRFW